MKRRGLSIVRIVIAAASLVSLCMPASAITRTWDAGGDKTNWFNGANWNPDGVPEDGDATFITNAATTVILSNTTAMLDSLTISNTATLIFTNWTTTLYATNITVIRGAKLGLAAAFTNNGMSNRIYIVCSNLFVATNSAIDADGKGYLGGFGGVAGPPATYTNNGHGPGGGYYISGGGNSGGGGYGGLGARATAILGLTYGSPSAPVDPGSGGGQSYQGHVGGNGGGAVRVEASGLVTVNGVVTASGTTGSNGSGGGSGGSIYITCSTFAGSNGILRADAGSDFTMTPGAPGGGGGGGRIAVIYDPIAQSNQASFVQFSAARGWGQFWSGIPGTVFFPDTSLLQQNMTNTSGRLMFQSVNEWAPGKLSVYNSQVVFPSGFSLTVTNDVVLTGFARMEFTNSPSVLVGGNLILSNSASLYVWSAASNGVGPDYGTLVGVTGSLVLADTTSVFPYSDPTNGGSVLFQARNLSVALGGIINSDITGYWGGVTTNLGLSTNGYGPGGGQYNVSGGGYGGVGSGAAGGFGSTYGASTAPVDPGSGGGGAPLGVVGGAGGGLVRMQIDDAASIDGTITANGGGTARGGSGGGVHIRARRLIGGALAIIRANGGTGTTKGGGGGRIALTGMTVDRFSGALTVLAGGTGANTGGVGTIVRTIDPAYDTTLIVQGNPQLHGASYPNDYGLNGVFNGSTITNAVPQFADEANAIRYSCIGWAVTNSSGAVVASDTTTQAVFTVSPSLTLIWFWTNQFYLAASAATNGALQTDMTGWYTNGNSVVVTAVPDGGFYFLQWTGPGVPAGASTNNPLTVTMDQPRTVRAQFTANQTAEVKTWVGSGDWASWTNWTPQGMPGPEDAVVIKTGGTGPLLADPTWMASLVVSNSATLTLTNWSSALNVAGNVMVMSAATLTAAGPFPTSVMSNRIYVVCGSLTVTTNGTITMDSKGWMGGFGGAAGLSGWWSAAISATTNNGHGPGAGAYFSSDSGGGGYGGAGGRSGSGFGRPYGSAAAPTDPGSGGGQSYGGGVGGSGGGAIWIQASGAVSNFGTISANGQTVANSAGGGSGGAIYIACNTFASSNGILRANGGADTTVPGGAPGGGGGGGRIAIIYNAAAQASLARPTVPFSAAYGWGYYNQGDIGTLYFPDTAILQETNSYWGQLMLGSATNWAPNNFLLSNGWLRLVGVALTVTNDLTVVGTNFSFNRLEVSNAVVSCGGNALLNGSNTLNIMSDGIFLPTLTCGGSLTLTNFARIGVYSAVTNVTPDYGALMTVGGDMMVASNTWVFPYAHPTNGGAPLFRVRNLTVQGGTNTGFNADGLGYMVGPTNYADGFGPGRGRGGAASPYYYGGGGYGGAGGNTSVVSGFTYGWTYGSSNAPINSGSSGGGGLTYSRAGGGVIRIEATGTVTMAGVVTANGLGGGNTVGCGSGGGVLIRCKTIAGAGTIRANGGVSTSTSLGAGGGGGRIAVWFVNDQFVRTVNVTAAGGPSTYLPTSNSGKDGTIVWAQIKGRTGALLIIR